MQSGDDSGRMYRAMWPLPGGHGRFLATLLEMLEWVQQQPSALLPDFFQWMRQRYELGPETNTPDGYFQLVARFGYLEAKRGKLSLTAHGRSLLKTRDGQDVLDLLMREWVGVYDVLEAVAQLGAANGKQLLDKLKPAFPSWKTPAQYGWRLQWLHSLGCLEKAEGGYIITALGQRTLLTYAPLTHMAGSASPTILPSSRIPPSPIPIAETLDEDATPPEASEDEADTPAIFVVRDEAERLAEQVRRLHLRARIPPASSSQLQPRFGFWDLTLSTRAAQATQMYS